MGYFLLWWLIYGIVNIIITSKTKFPSIILALIGGNFLFLYIIWKGEYSLDNTITYYKRKLNRGYLESYKNILPGWNYINWVVRALEERKPNNQELYELECYVQYKFESINKNPWITILFSFVITMFISFAVMDATIVQTDLNKNLEAVEILLSSNDEVFLKTPIENRTYMSQKLGESSKDLQVLWKGIFFTILLFTVIFIGYSIRHDRLLAIIKGIDIYKKIKSN
jgi:hypothetical protein